MNKFWKGLSKEMGGIEFWAKDANALIEMFLPNVQWLHWERQAQSEMEKFQEYHPEEIKLEGDWNKILEKAKCWS